MDVTLCILMIISLGCCSAYAIYKHPVDTSGESCFWIVSARERLVSEQYLSDKCKKKHLSSWIQVSSCLKQIERGHSYVNGVNTVTLPLHFYNVPVNS